MNQKELNLLEHLEELRKRIIVVLIAFLIFFVGAFIFIQDIYQWILRDFDGKLAVLGPSDILWLYMMLAAVVAIAATIPVFVYQTWRFIVPGLTKQESKIILSMIPGFFLLFIIGIGFGYFVLFPLVLGFLVNLSAGQFETMYTADRYFKFLIHISLPFGFLFEMPLIVLLLTRLGILNPVRLAKARRVSYFVLVVVSIAITPPDIISDFLVTVPLLLLYELSVGISKIVYKKKVSTELGMAN
ncbi:twin-arginine translocase subunit TatC [Niallia oryzisoli]|uniref:Sec-independent protein translocase protein TatC n=1 Tax=Niallia oryzisoli TaxID=1737571 RepID=A0ABZ2CBY8_9BACI